MANLPTKVFLASGGISTHSRGNGRELYWGSGYFAVRNIGQMIRKWQFMVRAALNSLILRLHRHVLLTVCHLSVLIHRRWFTEGRIPYEFRPRHALLTMHVWFLHKRLLADRVDSHLALLVQVRSCFDKHCLYEYLHFPEPYIESYILRCNSKKTNKISRRSYSTFSGTTHELASAPRASTSLPLISISKMHSN